MERRGGDRRRSLYASVRTHAAGENRGGALPRGSYSPARAESAQGGREERDRVSPVMGWRRVRKAL